MEVPEPVYHKPKPVRSFFVPMKQIVDFVRAHRYGIAVVLILLLAAYLRLYRISEYMTFLGDEGRDALVVKRMIVDHKFTLLGPTASVGGFFLGPVYYYMMLPFLWLWNLDPTGPAVMVAILGVVTVFLVYRFTASAHSKAAGFFAATLYAVSPVVIAYSRSSWNPNVVPLFAMLLVIFLYRIAKRDTAANYCAAGVVLGIGIQLHYLFLFLYVVSAAYFAAIHAIGIVRFRIKNVAALLAGIFLGLSPFLLFEIRHGFPNTRSIIGFLQAGNETGFTVSVFFGHMYDVAYRMFGRLILRMPDPDMMATLQGSIQSVWNFFTVLFLAAVLLYLVRSAVKIIRYGKSHAGKGQAAFGLLMLFWFTLPVLLFGLYKKDVYDYYLGIIFPVPFILSAVIASKLTRYSKILPYIILTILFAVNWAGRPMKYPPNNQLGQVRKISETAYRAAEDKPFNFALITGGNSDHAYRYFFEIWGNSPVTIENETVDPERTSVTDRLIVICEIDNCQPLGHSLWEIAGFGRAEIDSQWEVPFVKIFRLRHYDEKDG
jgi:4-amino-4-deoxy-L-arabinose transferase-like glycosyltransferase